MQKPPYPRIEISFDKDRLYEAAAVHLHHRPRTPDASASDGDRTEPTAENRPLLAPLLLQSAAEAHRMLLHLEATFAETPAALIFSLTPSSAWQREHLPGSIEHFLVISVAEKWLQQTTLHPGGEANRARTALRSATLAVDTPVRRNHCISNH